MSNVLIQCGDHLENQNRVLTLALACRELGYNPVVLVYSHLTGGLLLSHGIDVVALDRFMPAGRIGKAKLRRRTRHLRLGDRYRGVPLRDVFETDRRRAPWLFTGDRARQRIASAVRHIEALNAIRRAVDPRFVFVWNGYTGVVANVLRCLVGSGAVPGAFLERGAGESGLFVDPNGTNGSSALAAHSAAEIARVSERVRRTVDPDELIRPDGPPDDERRGRGAALVDSLGRRADRVVFVPLQVQDDTNIIWFSPHVRTMRQLCLLVAHSLRAAGEEALIVVRPHPEERPDLALNLPIPDNLVVTAEGELEDWIDLSSAVVTINSTVGYQAALQRRPVITLGKGPYTDKGFTVPACPKTLPEALARCLRVGIQTPEETRHLERYIRVLYGRNMLSRATPTLTAGNAAVVQTLFDEAKLAPPEATPAPAQFNRLAIEPGWIAAAVGEARDALAHAVRDAGGVNVYVKLSVRDTRNLTYRKLAEPVAYDDLVGAVRGLIGCERARINVARSRKRLAPEFPTIVVQPETATASRFDVPHAFILDQYGTPHVATAAPRRGLAAALPEGMWRLRLRLPKLKLPLPRVALIR